MKISASPKADPNDDAILTVLQEAALEAGRVIMKHYANGCAVQSKKDSSPVTEADRDAEAIILAALASVVPTFRLSPRRKWRQDVCLHSWVGNFYWLILWTAPVSFCCETATSR